MANKRISELSSRTPSATDLMLVGDPTTGYSYKCLVSQVGGVTSVFGRTGTVTAQEGDYSLTLLSDVTITSPASGDILTYNGSSWVNSAGGFVPYTGATGNVNLGEYGILAGWYRLDTTPTGTPTNQGTIYWDDSFNTAAIIMNGTTQEIGHDQFYQAKNSTGTTIPKGTAVRFAGTDGGSGHLLIAPFLADGSNPSSYFMGVTAEAITNGSFGKVQSFGRLDGIDTSAFAEGDILYASTTVAGGFQTTVPQAPNNIVQVAAVISDSNNGKLLIRPTLGSKLTSDESVKLTSVANGNVLQYNSTLAVWENVAPSSLAVSNIYTANGTLTGNRTVTSGGFSLTFTGSNTASGAIARGLNLTHTLVAAANNDVLVGLDINPTFTNGAFTGVQNLALRIGGSTGLSYDQTNTRLAIGTTIQPYRAAIAGVLRVSAFNFWTSSGATALQVDGTSSFSDVVTMASGKAINWGSSSTAINGLASGSLTFRANSGNDQMVLFGTGNFAINTTTDAGFRLDVNGTMRVQGAFTLSNIDIAGLNVLNNFAVNIGGTASQNNQVTIGYGTTVGGNAGIAIGRIATSTSGRGIAIGFSAKSAGGVTISNGSAVGDAGAGSVCIGGTVDAAGFPSTIIIANSAAATADFQAIFGGYSGSGQLGLIREVYFGGGVVTGYNNVNKYVNIQPSGGSGTDVGGWELRLSAGRGTGSSTPSDIVFATSTATTTGTTLQTLTNRWWVKGGTGQLANVSAPDASAVLQLNSTTRGVLLPRMTTTQRNAIASPATGLIVYDTTTNSLDVYNGSAWLDILASDFLTIDNTNNRLGINTASPNHDLHVTGTAQITGNVLLAQSTATVGIGTITDSSYKLSVDGSIKSTLIRTSQPTGGVGVADWKLGSTATGTFTVDTGMCLQVEVGGTLYKVAIHT